MELEQQQKLYEEGNHICVAQFKGKKPFIDQKAVFCNLKGITYTLVATKHAHILDAFLDGCEVYNFEGFILGCPPWNPVDFINDYNECHEYLVIAKSLENCYCKFTESNYERLLLTHEEKSMSKGEVERSTIGRLMRGSIPVNLPNTTNSGVGKIGKAVCEGTGVVSW